MTTLYTQGTFDILHYGHLYFLERCHRLADEVVVALLTDKSVKAYRGKPPIMSYKERELALRFCRFVDRVIPSDNRKTLEEIEEIKPYIIAVGSDWANRDIYKQYRIKDRSKLNYKLIYIPYTENISCTEIKRRIKNE